MTLGPGIYTIGSDQYHAGADTEQPSLSAHIAHLMLTRSPRHAYTVHPQLGGQQLRTAAEEAKFNPGTAAHALLLQGEQITIHDVIFHDENEAPRIAQLAQVDGRPFAYIVPDLVDWRTNFAKQVRTEARRHGLIALLTVQWLQVQEMVASIREQLHTLDVDPPMFTDGKAEQTLIWTEQGVTCRARLDWLRTDLQAADDMKTTKASGNPHDWTRTTLWSIGADIEAAFHSRAVQAITGTRPPVRFLVCETVPPFAICPVTLAPDALTLADEKMNRAILLWKQCLQTGEWPCYPTQLCAAELPPWSEARFLEQQILTDMDEVAA